jgi:hypothetical protein
VFQKADLAITDLTITSEREAAVDFTHPFMSLGEQFNAMYIPVHNGIAIATYVHSYPLTIQ